MDSILTLKTGYQDSGINTLLSFQFYLQNCSLECYEIQLFLNFH